MMNHTISKSKSLKKGEAQNPSHDSQGDMHRINAKSVIETRISAKTEETEAGLNCGSRDTGKVAEIKKRTGPQLFPDHSEPSVDSSTQNSPQATQMSPFHRERVGHAPTTPGRSKLKSFNFDDETPNHSVTVPKFGDWNEDDPLAADDYSAVFRKIREEKQSGSTGFATQARSTYSDDPKRLVTSSSSRWCCLQWTKK